MEGVNVIEPENTPVLVKAAEYTNISLENMLQSSTTDVKQTLSLMMSSGKLPDIIHANGRRNLLQYAGDGVLIPLDELIDEYAPNIKKYFEQNPGVYKDMLSTDGKIYYIPSIADGDVSFGWFIRKDWLDRLGLEMPQNVDEYYNALAAFKTKDPNGNGNNDEIPYFNRNAGVKFDTSVT